MRCKMCGKNIKEKFYVHVNSSHKSNLKAYFKKYPEQEEEYYNAKKAKMVWNKGFTKETHPSIASASKKMKEILKCPQMRKERSTRMKNRYKNGDILTKEQRAKVIKAGNDGWVKKIKEATFEERKKLLKNFTTAGNKAQQEQRKNLTPEDYNRLYPFAKGVARYYNCDYCKKEMIAWFGGKPRSKKRFCDRDCFTSYQFEHPEYTFPKARRFYSKKMKTEFVLHSKLEEYIAIILDNSCKVISWTTYPGYIPYVYEGKNCRYHPDFFINACEVLEVKSNYVYMYNEKKTIAKLKAGDKFCKENNYTFKYWQFNECNLSLKKIKKDERVQCYL